MIMIGHAMQHHETPTRTLLFSGGNVRHFPIFVAVKRVKAARPVVS
jgi:hypothetical protein